MPGARQRALRIDVCGGRAESTEARSIAPGLVFIFDWGRLTSSMILMSHRTVVIRTFANEIEAQLAQARLEAVEIPSVLLRDDAGGLYPALQFIHGVRLAVRQSDAEAATRLLDDPSAFPDDLDSDYPDEPDGLEGDEWLHADE